MRETLLRQILLAAILALAALPLAATTALADMFHHTSHADLTPIGDAPLRSGFVNDIHTEGVTQSAHEIYQLSGALPDTDYVIALHIYGADATCSGSGRTGLATTISTNASGNAEVS